MPESTTAHASPSTSGGNTRLAASAFTVWRDRHSVACTGRLRLTDHSGRTSAQLVVPRVAELAEHALA